MLAILSKLPSPLALTAYFKRRAQQAKTVVFSELPLQITFDYQFLEFVGNVRSDV
jgi:hypothetical protein